LPHGQSKANVLLPPNRAVLPAGADGVLSQAQCYVYGYGQVDDAADSTCYPALTILKPGTRMMLTGFAQAAGPAVDKSDTAAHSAENAVRSISSNVPSTRAV